ncbi:MAG: 16S rRNA (cytosine(1402)-N(4))-methyltransferase RsmH [Bacteroidales bacterium]|jgi:16S rRNA (cytosine1402-N4)-methyltransferase|nr:16S rRNA (cytosine(1402)-N(4))-methyltransferase RsmH [Bacteroidales bacterium]MDD2632253.1 16S rRNA (cytosine(1402)-N(4))-methyltransferase RsmH [Bacteroidales bacterium]MDD3525891.1 16S rRNA (cytosine(1402)-N(4))-methyltransferase RsmH [Bacteroidales bacterium]MDY0335032.1 16S rRNA (cytosine(1402)-N(4))-methyltransferase RsmH [Bacteroidales bacterium]
MSTYHQPVLLKESISGLDIRQGGTYVDVTYGGGGHARVILERLQGGRLIAFDQDADALANRIDDERLVLIHHNFKYLKNFLQYHQALPVDGILADLGVSSHQFDEVDRGFSIRSQETLDMRMNRNQQLSAREVLNEYDEEQMTALFRNYGELPQARAISRALVQKREQQKLTTFGQVQEATQHLAQRGKENKFYARLMQALRIEINGELEALKAFLQQSALVLRPGGRLVVISYHSLEDRLVKNFIRAGNFKGEIEKDFYGNPSVPFEAVNRKPIMPSDAEQQQNSRSRSARLRIASKIKNPDHDTSGK